MANDKTKNGKSSLELAAAGSNGGGATPAPGQEKPKKLKSKEAKKNRNDAKVRLYEFELDRIYNRIDSESAQAGDTIAVQFHRNMSEEYVVSIISVLTADGYDVVRKNDSMDITVSW